MALAVVSEISARCRIVGAEPLRAVGVVAAARTGPVAVGARRVIVVVAVVAARPRAIGRIAIAVPRRIAVARGIGVVVIVAVAVPRPRGGDRATDDGSGCQSRPPAPPPPLHALDRSRRRILQRGRRSDRRCRSWHGQSRRADGRGCQKFERHFHEELSTLYSVLIKTAEQRGAAVRQRGKPTHLRCVPSTLRTRSRATFTSACDRGGDEQPEMEDRSARSSKAYPEWDTL